MMSKANELLQELSAKIILSNKVQNILVNMESGKMLGSYLKLKIVGAVVILGILIAGGIGWIIHISRNK